MTRACPTSHSSQAHISRFIAAGHAGEWSRSGYHPNCPLNAQKGEKKTGLGGPQERKLWYDLLMLILCAHSRLGTAEKHPAPLRPLDQVALRRVGTELHARLVRVRVGVRVGVR